MPALNQELQNNDYEQLQARRIEIHKQLQRPWEHEIDDAKATLLRAELSDLTKRMAEIVIPVNHPGSTDPIKCENSWGIYKVAVTLPAIFRPMSLSDALDAGNCGFFTMERVGHAGQRITFDRQFKRDYTNLLERMSTRLSLDRAACELLADELKSDTLAPVVSALRDAFRSTVYDVSVTQPKWTQYAMFRQLNIGDQFFDPECGEDFVKLSPTTALMLTDGASDDDEADTFLANDPVQILSADELHEVSPVVTQRYYQPC